MKVIKYILIGLIILILLTPVLGSEICGNVVERLLYEAGAKSWVVKFYGSLTKLIHVGIWIVAILWVHV
jgi:hypothetical protein